MKVVCLSDTHMLHGKIAAVPDGDILVHAGDFCNYGNYDEVVEFNKWLGGLPHKHKLIVPGNHDRCTQEDLAKCKLLLSNARLLVDEEVVIEGKRFYFSPWTPQFGWWNWMYDRAEGERVWSKVPDGLDVLVTHGPTAGLLDWVSRKDGTVENCGCQDLYNRVEDARPRFHVFGHIHEGYGKVRISSTTFVNAATCNGRYDPVNDPVEIEI